MIDYFETKEHPITRKMVLDAYRQILSKGQAAGVDGMSLSDYAVHLQANLYKLWNRLMSGSYFPQLVREKCIPKKDGGLRKLGIATVEDRIAQQVVRAYLEPKIETTLHSDNYGFRKGRSGHQAIRAAMKRCSWHSWAIDLDISKYFDTIDHGLLLKAVRKYTEEKWILMYIERWLKAGTLKEDGQIEERQEGSVQGGVHEGKRQRNECFIPPIIMTLINKKQKQMPDFIPQNEGQLILWLGNFQNKFTTTHAATLGYTPEQITIISNACTALVSALNLVGAAKTALRNKVESKRSAKIDNLGLLRTGR